MRKETIIYGIILIIIGLCTWLFLHLDIGEEAVDSDIIIVNEGTGPERANKGVELMLNGYADQIIVSPPTANDESILPWYYAAGAQEEDLILETQATSTWTNALYSIQIMEANGWDSALVVSSDFHMRRVRLAYERAAKGKSLNFTYVSAYPTQDGKEIPYTQHPFNFFMALNEIWKYPGYLLGLYHLIDL